MVENNEKIYVFTSRTDEKKLKQRRVGIVINLLLVTVLAIAGSVLLAATIVWFAMGTERASFLEWIGEVVRSLTNMFNTETLEHMRPRTLGKLIAIPFMLAFTVIPAIMYYFRQTGKSYDMEVTIDLNTNTITCKEENKEAVEFGTDEIDKWWYFRAVQRKTHGDCFMLKNGKPIKIDGFFDDKVHKFLTAHAKEMNLPKKHFAYSYQMETEE